jgi:hypothetical protein
MRGFRVADRVGTLSIVSRSIVEANVVEMRKVGHLVTDILVLIGGRSLSQTLENRRQKP